MFSDQKCDGERQVQIEIVRLMLSGSERKKSGAKKAEVWQSWRVWERYVKIMLYSSKNLTCHYREGSVVARNACSSCCCA